MHIVIVQEDESMPVELVGPFPTALHAADWASDHASYTPHVACQVVQLTPPRFYGESL